MTTLAELVAATPAFDRGIATQIAHNSGSWRWVVELADPSAGVSVVWYDITTAVAGVDLQRGADQYAGRYRAAVAYLELYATDDSLAPWNEDTSATFGTHVDLGAGLIIRGGFIRVNGATVAEWLPRFCNRVESWGDGTYARGSVRRHTIVTRDLITGLVNVPVAADAADNWWDRVAHVLTEAGWDFDDDLYGAELDSVAADVLPLPASSENSNALDELQKTLDPAGCTYRTDRTGKLIMHPQPWDTWHAGIFTAGGSGNEYTAPATVTFSHTAEDDGHTAYGSGGVEPFGIDDTELAVTNHVVVNATTTYDIEDATSIARYGRRTRTLSWQEDNDDVADDLLAHLKVAHRQARPLSTTIDLQGFVAGVGELDHLSPVTITHSTGTGRVVVEADGYVRSISEQITPRGAGGVDWRATVVVDIDTDSTTELMNAPTSLSAGTPGETSATFTWSNPSQTITPTATQIRLRGISSIWVDVSYPITSLTWSGLAPGTAYEFDVRYVKRVDDIITNQSGTASVSFTTATPTVPVVRTRNTGGVSVNVPAPGEGCTFDWELQRSDDGSTWTTVDSGSGTTPLLLFDPSDLTGDYLWRVRTREDCGTPGAWVVSVVFAGSCLTPAILSTSPYTSSALTMYVPAFCPPNRIVEYVSGVEGTPGPEFDGILARYDSSNDPAVVADDAGIVAYGKAPGIVGQVGDQTVSATVNTGTVSALDGLVSLGSVAIGIVDVSGNKRFQAVARLADGEQLSVTGTTNLASSTEYDIRASYTQSTGVLQLWVDDTSEGTDTAATVGQETIDPIGLYVLRSCAGGWIADAAAWNVTSANRTVAAKIVDTGAYLYWIRDESAGTTASDSSGNARDGTYLADASLQAWTGPDGVDYADGTIRFATTDLRLNGTDASAVTVFLIVGDGGGDDLDIWYGATNTDPMPTSQTTADWLVNDTDTSYRVETVDTSSTTHLGKWDYQDDEIQTNSVLTFVVLDSDSVNPLRYLDGVDIGGDDIDSAATQRTGGTHLYVRGRVAHFAVFDSQLSASDIADLYAAAAVEGW